jgi:O-antigen/teichoic acid export membrane protein
MSIVRRIAKNTSFLIISKVSEKILTSVFIIFLARYLGVEELGRYSFALAFTALFGIIINFGFWSLLPREVARAKHLSGEYLSNGIIIRLATTLFSTGVVAVLLLFMKKPLEVNIMVLMAMLIFIPGSISGVLGAIFYGHERMEYPTFTTIFTQVVTISISIYGVILGWKALELISIALLGAVLNSFMMVILIRKILPSVTFKIDFRFIREIIKKALPFLAFSLLATYYSKIDMTMLSLMKGDEAVGLYSVSFRIREGLLFIPNSLMISLYPVMSVFYQTSYQRLKESFERAFKYLLALALPIAVGGCILAKQIILLLFGEEYLLSSAAFRILIWATAITFLKYPLGTLFSSTNRVNLLSIMTVASLGLNVLLNFYFIPRWSFFGASITTLLGEAFSFVILIILAIKLLKSTASLKFCLKPLLISLLLGLGLLVFRNINFFILLFTTPVVYFTSLFLSKFFTESDLKILSQLRPHSWIKV